MKISELQLLLENFKKEHGDITVCHSEPHEYWGSFQSHLTEGYNINFSEHGQPDGPKSGKSEKCIIIGA